MFFVFGYDLSERLPRVLCEVPPPTLTERSSYCFVTSLKRKILLRFNDISFQLGLERFHIREIFYFKAVVSLRVFVTAKYHTFSICVQEYATVISKAFVALERFSNV